MNMSREEAQWIIGWLVDWLPIDSPAPYFLANFRPDREGWQYAVDMIYRFLKSGLVDLWPDGVLGEGERSHFLDIDDFCRALAQQDPSSFDETSSDRAPWIAPALVLTEFGKKLNVKYGMDWDKFKDLERTPINEAYMGEIEALFEQHGVAMTFVPIVPIRPE